MQKFEPVYMKLPEVVEVTRLSSPTIWRMEQRGDFPKRVKIGKRAVAWRISDIQMWVGKQQVRLSNASET
jgi:prophage regulatory protein